MNDKHQGEEIKIICLNPTCKECPLLCSICLAEFSHSDCKYKLITIRELEKGELWKMNNWPTRPEHYEIKERIRQYDDLIELDELIQRITDSLRARVNQAINEFKISAKARYRLLIEKR